MFSVETEVILAVVISSLVWPCKGPVSKHGNDQGAMFGCESRLACHCVPLFAQLSDLSVEHGHIYTPPKTTKGKHRWILGQGFEDGSWYLEFFLKGHLLI
jgi:hypothetical protein